MSRRTARLSEEIREEVARVISGELKDPRIGFVTVTRVSMAPDLRNARIFVGVLGSELDRKKTLVGLTQAAGYLRRLLGQRLRLRYTPQIVFEYDTGLDASDRVAKLLEATRASSTPAALDEAADDAGDDPDEDGQDADDDADDVKKRG